MSTLHTMPTIGAAKPSASPSTSPSPSPSSSSSSTPTTAPSPTTSPSQSLSISTVAAAGRHNAYIWEKLDYFFSWRLLPDPAKHMPPHGDQSSKVIWSHYGRAALMTVVLTSLALVLCNMLLLPLQLLAYATVIVQVLYSSSHIGVWPAWILRVNDICIGAWMGFTATLLEFLGMKVKVTGDIITQEQFGEGALILSNHPTSADWIYLWSWLIRLGNLSRLKIVLKASLHKAPIIGWALQCGRYMFLQRRWQEDKDSMRVLATHWAGGEETIRASKEENSSEKEEVNQVQVLIFPEGTDMRPYSYDQSIAFAERAEHKNKLTRFQHVLQPRVTGFIHLVKLLRHTGSVKAIYDITLGSSPVPVTIENFGRGILPTSVSFHMRRYELSLLPTTDDELAEWLMARWDEKDQRLDKYYAQPKETRAFEQDARVSPSQVEKARLNTRFRKFSITLLSILALLCHAYAGLCHPLLMVLYHAVMIGVWTYFTRTEGGFDALILKVEQQANERKAKLAQSGNAPSSSPSPSPVSVSAGTKKEQ